MLRKMTIKVGKHGWAIIGPTTQNQPSVRSFRASWAKNSTSSVETLVLDQCWANVNTLTMTCCKQLKPLPNVGPPIACYLGCK